MGLVTGSTPPFPAPTASGYRAPDARPKDARSGVEERPTLYIPHHGKRGPPQAPSFRPHSAESGHPRARAVGLVTGPQAHIPRTDGRG